MKQDPTYLYHWFLYALLILGVACAAAPVFAGTTECAVDNRLCVMKHVHDSAKKIEKQSWRDQTLRELAKSYAADNQIDLAIAVLADITTPDTKALTIRGIGMEAARLQGGSPEGFTQVIARLRIEAEHIEHPPSYAIALTYIAMAQAFAKDNEGAWKTASDMKNDALRHKAYAETAEIQAEYGDFDAAMKSISFIDSEAFRNKAYTLVSKLLAERSYFAESYQSALAISNAYKQSTALQFLLNTQRKTAQKQAALDHQEKGDAP